METLHGLFASGLYNIYIDEYQEENKEVFKSYYNNLKEEINVIVDKVIEIEDNIIDFIFRETDSINGVKPEDLHKFIRDRTNKVLVDIKLEPKYKDTDNSVNEWFYKGVNSLTLHDFFSTNSSQYRRNWKVEGFSLLPLLKDSNE